jgi:hypothetical protein
VRAQQQQQAKTHRRKLSLFPLLEAAPTAKAAAMADDEDFEFDFETDLQQVDEKQREEVSDAHDGTDRPKAALDSLGRAHSPQKPKNQNKNSKPKPLRTSPPRRSASSQATSRRTTARPSAPTG